MVFKVDFLLEGIDDNQEATSDVKAGERVDLRREPDGSLACIAGGSAGASVVIGRVPSANVSQLNTAAQFDGQVRTLKRRPGENTVIELQVRFTAGQPPPRAPGPPRHEDTEEDVARLSAEQLQLLAESEEVRWYLRDERLQDVVRGIDGAAHREAALTAALQAPNFKEFTDKVVGLVAPQPGEN